MDKRISVTKRMADGQRKLDSVDSLVGTDSPDDFEYEGQFEANAADPLTQTASAVASGHATMARNASMSHQAAGNQLTASQAVASQANSTSAKNAKAPYVTVDSPDDFE